MTSKLTILPATETELPILAHIAIAAMEADILHRVMFPSNDPLNTTFKESFVLTSLKISFGKPRTRFLKAVEEGKRQIVVYAILVFCEEGTERRKDGEKGEKGKKKKALMEGDNLDCWREINGFMRID